MFLLFFSRPFQIMIRLLFFFLKQTHLWKPYSIDEKENCYFFFLIFFSTNMSLRAFIPLEGLRRLPKLPYS
jgi:hypothetical protein